MPDDFDIENANVQINRVKELEGLLLHVTGRGREYDSITRSFAPKMNVTEDPVCGSGHCHTVPYWVETLGKDSLVCYQASPRGGILYCTQTGDRILMSGRAAVYSAAELFV